MTQQLKDALRILRIKQVKAQMGLPNSTIYDHIGKGLFCHPIKLSERCSGWLESEVTAIMGARISGKSEADIKSLVIELENQRLTNWG